MASDNEKTIQFPSKDTGAGSPEKKKKNKEEKVRKPHKSFGWFFGVVILILISITFVLPATLFSSGNSSEIVFGKYNGRKIVYSYDSFYYYQVQQLANYYAQQYGGQLPANAYFQIFYQAFQNSAFYEALAEMADDVKIEPSKSFVAKSIVDSGYWNNEEGVFDQERYNSATALEKDSVQRNIEISVPYQFVMGDIASAKIPTTESDFIASLSNENVRSFDYLVVGPESYGDYETESYINSNPEPFMQIEATERTYSTLSDAQDALAAFNAGTETFESDDIKSSLIYKYQLDSALRGETTEGASDLVFSTVVGSIAGPYLSTNGYSLYKVNSAPALADTTNADVLSNAKNYIAANDSAIITPYIAGVANDAYEMAKTSVDDAIAEYGLQYYSVDDVAMNTGNASFVYSIQLGDYSGYLANAASDTEYLKTLYSAELDTPLEPRLAGNSSYIIVIPTQGTTDSEDTTSYAGYIKNMYSSAYSSGYANQFSLVDLQSSVLSSDKLEDNFMDTYFSKIMGSNN